MTLFCPRHQHHCRYFHYQGKVTKREAVQSYLVSSRAGRYLPVDYSGVTNTLSIAFRQGGNSVPPPTEVPLDKLIEVIINNGIGVGCAIVILLVFYFRETKTIPIMFKNFSDGLHVIENSQHSGIEALKDLVRDIEKNNSDRSNRALEVFQQMVSEERSNYQRWHEENRGVISGLTNEIKENRHAIKNIAHEFGMKRAVEQAREAVEQARRQEAIQRRPDCREDNT